MRYAVLFERASRFPAAEQQIAPTALGNAIRRFETYAGDRYQLDSQLLWNHLATAAPDRVVVGVENARTNVDFFVCLLYGMLLSASMAGVGLVLGAPDAPRLVAALVIAAIAVVLSYRLAVVATDPWESAVRAMVDHGRLGVAKAFGLTIPRRFEDERLMWRTVNTLVRRPYEEAKAKDVDVLLDRWRGGEGDGEVPGDNASPEADGSQQLERVLAIGWLRAAATLEGVVRDGVRHWRRNRA